MYAVIRCGGRQERVHPGDRVKVEKLALEPGSQVTISEVLMVAGEGEPRLGEPLVPEARVKATVEGHGLRKKVIAFKYRRRKGFHKKRGHRQQFTTLRIDKIWIGPEPAEPAPVEPAAVPAPEAAANKEE